MRERQRRMAARKKREVYVAEWVIERDKWSKP